MLGYPGRHARTRGRATATYQACEARDREWLVPDVPSSKVPGAAESERRGALAPPAAGADATGNSRSGLTALGRRSRSCGKLTRTAAGATGAEEPARGPAADGGPAAWAELIWKDRRQVGDAVARGWPRPLVRRLSLTRLRFGQAGFLARPVVRYTIGARARPPRDERRGRFVTLFNDLGETLRLR